MSVTFFPLLCILSFCLSQADPAGFHSELQRLATCFFKPEAISWKEATSLAKRPRGGKGAAAFIRKRPASTPASGPVAKRPKTASSATGRLTCLFIDLLSVMSARIHTVSILARPVYCWVVTSPSQLCFLTKNRTSWGW